jgi:hypothetical protein
MIYNKPFKSGVIIEDIKPEDWLFGAKAIDMEVKVEDGNWNKYLPKNEKQRNGFESMCCTNFSSTTAVEILFTRLIEEGKLSASNLQWLKDKGYFDDTGHINFSDRFDAIVSGTRPEVGNSLKAPAEAKRKMGLIPESMLPWVDDKNIYFNKNKITQEMYALGAEFLTRFAINYEMVYETDIVNALKVSPVAGACFAWNGTDNKGVFVRVDNSINHAICRIKPPKGQQLMDSYDPFIKTMADNYNFLNYGIRYIVREIPQFEEPIINNKDMLKTIRFKTSPKIYLVSNVNSKEILHIEDEASWGILKKMGFIKSINEADEVIEDGFFPQYTVLPNDIKIPFKTDPNTNPFTAIINFFKSLGFWKK